MQVHKLDKWTTHTIQDDDIDQRMNRSKSSNVAGCMTSVSSPMNNDLLSSLLGSNSIKDIIANRNLPELKKTSDFNSN